MTTPTVPTTEAPAAATDVALDDFPPDPLDIFDPEVRGDPYPRYAALRAQSPVHYLEADDLYLVSRYDDLMGLLRDPGTFSSKFTQGPQGFRRRTRFNQQMQQSVMTEQFSGLRILIGTDPPDHTTLRRLVARPFTPRNIGAREEHIREITHGLVDDLVAARDSDGTADLVRYLTYPLPVIVIAEVLGIPPERREDFKRWSDAFVGGFDGNLAEAEMLERRTNMMEMFSYFNEVVEERQAEAVERDDVISMILAGTEGEDAKLSVPEVIMFCVLLLVAGNETTTNLIGNLWNALFEHPDQRALLAANPDLATSAVEEALRFDSPIQALFRIATRDTDLAGVPVPKDARIMPLFASGNRDESHYEGADQFLINRNPTDHMGFGAGIHLCLGAPLARLETRIATEVLLERLPGLRPAGEAERNQTNVLRGFRKLPVTW